MLKVNKKIVVLGLICLFAFTCLSMTFGGQKVFAVTYEEPDNQAVETLSETETQNTTDVNGLGLGINVVTANNLNDFKIGYTVFDTQEINEHPRINLPYIRSLNRNYSLINASDLLEVYASSFGLNLSVEAFIASVSFGFETSNSYNYENYQYKYYNVYRQLNSRYRLSLQDHLNSSTYQNYFTDTYLADLSALSNGTITYETFFNRYGTHIVGSAVYGGDLIMSYSVMSNDIVINTSIKNTIEASFSALEPTTGIKASIATAINNAHNTNYTENSFETSYYVSAVGGNAFASNIPGNFNDAYLSWCESFNIADDEQVNVSIIDYPEDGLVPLWDILPTAYAGLSSTMETAFEEYYKEYADEFNRKFGTGNVIDFYGGLGTISEPYLIANAEHLLNVNNDMTAHYKLHNDIDLSGFLQWVPLGACYLDVKFTGTFDGNGKTISSLRRTSDIQEVNSRFYFGLFGCIGTGGVVKDLNFTNVYIYLQGPAVDNSSAKVFIGAVAGMVNGTVENVTVSGLVKNDICTNGVSFVGGITGITEGTVSGSTATKAIIKNCTNNATVYSGRFSSAAGGITAYARCTQITNSINNGSVEAKCTGWGGRAISGGIIGELFDNSGLDNTIVGTSYSYGNVVCNYYSWGIGCEFYRNTVDGIIGYKTTAEL